MIAHSVYNDGPPRHFTKPRELAKGLLALPVAPAYNYKDDMRRAQARSAVLDLEVVA